MFARSLKPMPKGFERNGDVSTTEEKEALHVGRDSGKVYDAKR